GHGMEIEPIEVKKGDKISEPLKPEAEGYSFMGWYKEAGCKTLWNFEKDTVSKNTILYAGWKKTGDSENPYEPPADIPDGIWIAPIRNYTYTGRAITPVVHVYYNKQKLILGRDYTVTYRNNTKAAGEWEKKAPQVCVKGKGNYTGTAKRSFTIEKAYLTDENLKAAEIYGEKMKYTPVVALDGNPLKAGKDYTLTYSNANGVILKKRPTTIGSYQMHIIGKGNCVGQIDFSYRIDAQGGAATIDKGTAIVGSMIYDGAEPQVTLTVGGRTLKRNTDYMVSFANIHKKGTATATFIGIGSYVGTLKKNFKVQAASIQWNDVVIDENVMYEKGGAKPKPSVTVNGTELVSGTDYTVTYKNNIKIGYAEVTVKGKGNYAGVLTKPFKVEPKKLTAEGVKIYVPDVVYGKKPTVIVYDSNGKKLSANRDYMVYIDNIAHNVTITDGKNGLYKTQVPIIIEYRELEKGRLVSSVTLNKKAFGFPKYFEYTGMEVELEKDWLTVKAGKTVLNNDAFEVLGYVNNIEKGTASVIIQGTEGYGGIKVLNFKIKAKGLF
nr:InlB B-repeat-containing protein [Lachnospiraceae bacterium]